MSTRRNFLLGLGAVGTAGFFRDIAEAVQPPKDFRMTLPVKRIIHQHDVKTKDGQTEITGLITKIGANGVQSTANAHMIYGEYDNITTIRRRSSVVFSKPGSKSVAMNHDLTVIVTKTGEIRPSDGKHRLSVKYISRTNNDPVQESGPIDAFVEMGLASKVKNFTPDQLMGYAAEHCACNTPAK